MTLPYNKYSDSTTVDSMSSSDSDDVGEARAFIPGSTNPEDFFKEVRVVTAHKRRRGNAALLGELIRRMDHGTNRTMLSVELLRWVDANEITDPTTGAAVKLDADPAAALNSRNGTSSRRRGT